MVLEDETKSLEVLNAILRNDIESLRMIYTIHDLDTEIQDDFGMTPLQNAAYKGNDRIVRWLLDRGADIDSSNNKFQCTALHFGVLSGNAVVCSLLLAAGAKTNQTNTKGHTASQLGTSVGNHNCVAVISNYVPEEKVWFYTLMDTNDSEPLLPLALAKPVHKFVIMTNIHPVKVALEIPSLFLVDKNASKIYKILNLMCEREMKKHLSEPNDVMAFKFHYLASILMEIIKYKDMKSENESDPKEIFIKKLLKNNNYLEQILKDSMRKFPFRDCSIFKKMIAGLAQIKESMTALDVIMVMIGNRRGMGIDLYGDERICGTCTENNATKVCAKCKAVLYCDGQCQSLHWFIHKKECNKDTGNI